MDPPIEASPGRPPRVLVLTPEFAPYAWGGLATYLHAVVPRLVTRGIRVDVVVAPTYARDTLRVDVDGLPLPLLVDPDADPEDQFAAVNAEWGERYDAAFVQDPQAAPLAALLLSRSICRRVIATAHLPTYGGFSYFDKPEDDAQHQALEAMLFRLSHRVVAPSAFAADVVLQVHRLDRSDVAVIPYGAPALEPAARRRPAGAPLDVISVGRIAKQKGLEDLCAIAGAVPAHVALFSHIGSARKGGDDNLLQLLQQARISVLGHRDHREVLARMLEADVVLSTSMYETFGLALLEGMAAGAVPVAFECGAFHEFMVSGECGVLVRPGDVAAVVDELHALHGDPARLCDLRRGAIATAQSFSWETHVAELSGVLLRG